MSEIDNALIDLAVARNDEFGCTLLQYLALVRVLVTDRKLAALSSLFEHPCKSHGDKIIPRLERAKNVFNRLI